MMACNDVEALPDHPILGRQNCEVRSRCPPSAIGAKCRMPRREACNTVGLKLHHPKSLDYVTDRKQQLKEEMHDGSHPKSVIKKLANV